MFIDLWDKALLPLLVIAGYQAAKYRPGPARTACRAAAALSAVVFASLVVSGAWRPSPAVADYHRYASHGLVILDWLLVFPAIGAAARLDFSRRPWRTTGQIIGLVAVLGFTLLTAFTGYLGPSHEPNQAGEVQAEETHNRFLVLHCVALPAIVAAITAAWLWSFRVPKSPESHRLSP
jgi:hypothetical protein